MKRILSFLLLCTISISVFCQNADSSQLKYVFLFIGDGFGLSQSMLAEGYLDAVAKDTATIHLQMLKMPVLGMIDTYSASNFVTCSSASGTALATGCKTDNNKLGVNPQNVPLQTIAEFLHKKNFKIGIISSCPLDHATPAAFYANTSKRNNYDSISLQMPSTGFDFFGGGGLIAAKRGTSFYDNLSQADYLVSNDKQAITNHTMADGKLYAYSNSLDNEFAIASVIDNPTNEMPLSFFVRKAISLFEPTTQPFFIMTEGGKIDWACHDNDPGTTVQEILEMDKAYIAAYEFYLRHPDETLIIITADHETGGLSIGRNSKGYNCNLELLQYQNISYDNLKLTFNRLAKQKTKNSLADVYALLENHLGFNNGNQSLALNKRDSLQINFLYKHLIQKNIKNPTKKIKAKMKKLDIDSYSLARLGFDLFNAKVGVGWTSGGHTGVAVPVRAIGYGSERFSSLFNNTEIPYKILQSLGFEDKLNDE